MIAHIKEMAVSRNKWLTEETFRDGVVICQSVPGATAMQMAAYVGLRVRGGGGATGEGSPGRGERDVPLRAGRREKAGRPGPGRRRRRAVLARREPVRGHRRRGDRRGPIVSGACAPPPLFPKRKGAP